MKMIRFNLSKVFKTSLVLLFLVLPFSLSALSWPKELNISKGKIVVYQPQPEKLDGNRIFGRSAIAFEPIDNSGSIFGVFWFNAQIDTDQDSGKALVHSFVVSRVRWPESTKLQEERLTVFIENKIPNSGFEISLERLKASLANVEVQQKSLEKIKNDAPEIVFSDSLSVLMIYDGMPRFSEIKNSAFKRAVNTPFMVASNSDESAFYSSNGSTWYQSENALGPWAVTSSPPKELVALLNQAVKEKKSVESDTVVPKIIVATKPTELVVTSGKPNWASLAQGELLYVTNTETPWLREISSNQNYLLLSGRWFRSKALTGPWEFVRADKLPVSFASIPPASDIGGIRSSIAGTDEANEALVDFFVPQTAAIKKSEAKLEVTYDGKPQFKRVDGTNVFYAENTATQVLRIGMRYYAVDNGVWFDSPSASGPWAVADSIPTDQIAEIPASSPVYNTTYVHVYHSTPEVVYVGYTPGYMWSFPYYGVPIYGSGWHYPPYYGSVYYPGPVTWGMHVGYNSYTGWNYGMTWSNGWLSVGFSWGYGYGGGYGCCYGWHGGYPVPVIVNRGPVIINNGNINIGNSINAGNRQKLADSIANNPNFDSSRIAKGSGNIYNRAENMARNADRDSISSNLERARESRGLENNIFADREGNVLKRDSDQWLNRQNGQWKADPALNSKEKFQQALDNANARERINNQRQSGNSDYSRRQNLNDAFSSRQMGDAREKLRGRRQGGGRRH